MLGYIHVESCSPCTRTFFGGIIIIITFIISTLFQEATHLISQSSTRASNKLIGWFVHLVWSCREKNP